MCGVLPDTPIPGENLMAKKTKKDRFARLQKMLAPYRFYGDGGTIHGTTHLDVETRNGEVVAVWFRCSLLPFEQHEINHERAEVRPLPWRGPKIHGIVFEDPEDDLTNG